MRLGQWCLGTLVLVSALWACDEPAPDLSEWTVADHDQPEEKPRRRPGAPAPTHAEPSKRNQVIDVTWLNQCASCHGRKGKGDGPSSMMVKARDLTLPEWQASVTDEQLATVIRKGKDKMPAFNLPDSIVDGLVQHIRGLQQKPRAGAGEPAAHGVIAPPSGTPAPASGSETTAPASTSADEAQ